MATTKPARPSKIAAREQRRAAAARRVAERREYRRFTTRSRQRRLAATATVGGVVLVAIMTVVLTTSPILSLRTIRVEGTTRIPSDDIVTALSGLGGQPLARVSPDDVLGALSGIDAIESFDTRFELPGTMVVSVVERTPIGVVRSGTSFHIIDRAAVVLEVSPTRPSEFPLIAVPANPDDRGFMAIGEALEVIPGDVLARIDQVTASSADTVGFTLKNSDHQVLWGSSEASGRKARVLPAALVTAGSGTPQLIDLSTPDTVVIRDVGAPVPTPTPPAPGEPGPEDSEQPPGDTPEALGADRGPRL